METLSRFVNQGVQTSRFAAFAIIVFALTRTANFHGVSPTRGEAPQQIRRELSSDVNGDTVALCCARRASYR